MSVGRNNTSVERQNAVYPSTVSLPASHATAFWTQSAVHSPHSSVIAVWPQLFCTAVWVLLQGTVDSSQTAPQNTSCCCMFRLIRNLLHIGRPVYRRHVSQKPEHNLWSPSKAGEFQPAACAIVCVRVHIFGARLLTQFGEGGKWHPKYFST